MLDQNSYLARPPTILDQRSRYTIEAIAYAMQAIQTNLGTLRQITEQLNIPADVPNQKRIELFSACWNIVDQTHMLRTLIKFADPSFQADYIKSFFNKYECATVLRNKMDHLRQNIPNWSQMASHNWGTIFGSLSYFKNLGFTTNKDAVGVRHGNIVTIPFGTLSLDKKTTIPSLNPVGKPLGETTSLFELAAFGLVMELWPLALDLQNLASRMEASIRDQVFKAVDNQISQTSIDVLLNQPTQMVVVAHIEFAPQ